MKQILLIMNPNSGTKKANKYLTDIILLFKKYNYDTRVCLTTNSNDAHEFVSNFHRKSDIIVCIGGDGTLNQVVTSMIACKCDIPIGYIPSGSTNDFATGMKLNKKIMDAAKDIMSGSVSYIDVGMFNDRCFCYIASTGLFTKTSYQTSQTFKNTYGHLAYFLEGIKDLASIKSSRLRFEYDNKVFEDDYIFAAVCNSTSVGGVLKLNSDFVDLNDGLFEIFLVKMPKNLLEFNSIMIAINSRDYSTDMITFLSVPQVKITSFDDVDWTIDGEFMSGTDVIEMKTIRNAVKFIIPNR